MVFAFDHSGVIVRAEQLVDFTAVGRHHDEQPTITIGIAIDGFRRIDQLLVHRDDLARDRAVDIGGRLHRLDDSRAIAGLHVIADTGQFDVDEVAERRLCVVGDSDHDVSIVFGTRPPRGSSGTSDRLEFRS